MQMTSATANSLKPQKAAYRLLSNCRCCSILNFAESSPASVCAACKVSAAAAGAQASSQRPLQREMCDRPARTSTIIGYQMCEWFVGVSTTGFTKRHPVSQHARVPGLFAACWLGLHIFEFFSLHCHCACLSVMVPHTFFDRVVLCIAFLI